MPMASAEDGAARRIKLRPKSTIQQVSAEEEAATADQRWSKLKAKSAEDDLSAVPAKLASRPQPAGLIRPFPDDEEPIRQRGQPAEDAWEDDELAADTQPDFLESTEGTLKAADEPSPITGYEQPPDWILGHNSDLAEELTDEAEELTEEADAAAAQPTKRLAARRLFDEVAKDAAPVEPPEAAVPEEPLAEPTASGTDAGYTPMQSGSRRPRQIKDISPRYDKEIDRDIREFAKQQAKQYGLEFGKGQYEPRAFYGLAYQWEPTNFYHYPLYFEDPQLERYGHTYSPVTQPIASIARFSGQLLMLPYQMTIDPICCPKYALGWYRPGDCAPYLHYQVPLNAQAAAVEAGVITGLFFLIP